MKWDLSDAIMAMSPELMNLYEKNRTLSLRQQAW
jgi:hypothetical protein